MKRKWIFQMRWSKNGWSKCYKRKRRSDKKSFPFFEFIQKSNNWFYCKSANSIEYSQHSFSFSKFELLSRFFDYICDCISHCLSESNWYLPFFLIDLATQHRQRVGSAQTCFLNQVIPSFQKWFYFLLWNTF